MLSQQQARQVQLGLVDGRSLVLAGACLLTAGIVQEYLQDSIDSNVGHVQSATAAACSGLLYAEQHAQVVVLHTGPDCMQS
jgi:hypothetical protein